MTSRIRDLAEAVAVTVDVPALDTSKPDGTTRKPMNVDRLNAMGWTAKTSLREGLAVAYRDFVSHV
jgi:GDP-L-fucose synthase